MTGQISCLVVSFYFQKSVRRHDSPMDLWRSLFRRWPGLNVILWLFLTHLCGIDLLWAWLLSLFITKFRLPSPSLPKSMGRWAGSSSHFWLPCFVGHGLSGQIRSLCWLLPLMASSWQFTTGLPASSLHEFQAPSHCSFQRAPKLGKLPVDQIFISWNFNQTHNRCNRSSS